MSLGAGLLVALGAAVGAPLRFLLGHLYDDVMPWGTVAANLAGSFLIGVLAGLAVDGNPYALLGTGFCGALTTYSSFAVHVEQRDAVHGGATLVVTVVGGLILCWLGFVLAA